MFNTGDGISYSHAIALDILCFWKINQWCRGLEVRVYNSWITNQFLDPMNQKFVKVPLFTNCFFFQRNDNLKIVSAEISVKWVRLNDERTKFRRMVWLVLNYVVNYIIYKIEHYYESFFHETFFSQFQPWCSQNVFTNLCNRISDKAYYAF